MYRIHHADCFDWLRDCKPRSLHAVCTDPPYGVLELHEKRRRREESSREKPRREEQRLESRRDGRCGEECRRKECIGKQVRCEERHRGQRRSDGETRPGFGREDRRPGGRFEGDEKTGIGRAGDARTPAAGRQLGARRQGSDRRTQS